MRTTERRWLAVLLLVTAAACGGTAEVQTPASQSPGPALVVERFLRAANANDLETMTGLFGTREQTIREREGTTRSQQRMYVLASVLRHEDWSVVGQEKVPGRLEEATELLVRIETPERTATVPFLVVRKKGGGWIIERIGIEPLTSGS